MNRRSYLVAGLFSGLCALSSTSGAQQLPKPTQAADAASAGKTDLTSDKAAVAERNAGADSKDATELSLSFGGMTASGNSRLVALTTVERFRFRRDENQFKAALAGNYGRTALPGTDFRTSVQNIQGLARFDRFLGDFTLFMQGQARNDKFQGLDLRLVLDPGVGYYFINQKSQQLWTEIGYDFLYDIRREDSRQELDADKKPVVDAAGHPKLLPSTRSLHSGRLYLGYEHALVSGTKLVAGVEYLQGLSDTGVYRLNSDIAVNAKLWEKLSISVSFGERYENEPLPGKEKLDTLSAASLVYTLL